jgi:hypothetical protein
MRSGFQLHAQLIVIDRAMIWNQAIQNHSDLERFRAKWIPVRVKKTRQNNPRAPGL